MPFPSSPHGLPPRFALRGAPPRRPKSQHQSTPLIPKPPAAGNRRVAFPTVLANFFERAAPTCTYRGQRRPGSAHHRRSPRCLTSAHAGNRPSYPTTRRRQRQPDAGPAKDASTGRSQVAYETMRSSSRVSSMRNRGQVEAPMVLLSAPSTPPYRSRNPNNTSLIARAATKMASSSATKSSLCGMPTQPCSAFDTPK